MNTKKKEGLYYQGEVGTVKTSLSLNFGTNFFTCLPKHSNGQRVLIKYTIIHDISYLFFIY